MSQRPWVVDMLTGRPVEAQGQPDGQVTLSVALEAFWGRAIALLPQEQHRRWDRELAAVTDAPCVEILHRGAGWGALERRRVAASGAEDRVPAVLWFGEEALGPEQEPWLALLERGELPGGDPQQEPGAWLVQPEWEALLRARPEAAAGGEHWLAWLHRGNMRREALDFTGAREAWEQSLRERRNGWALRNLAVLESEEGRPTPVGQPPAVGTGTTPGSGLGWPRAAVSHRPTGCSGRRRCQRAT